jgi:hypothetical protein
MNDRERAILAAWEADVVRLHDRARHLRKVGQVQGPNGSRACAALAARAEREIAYIRRAVDDFPVAS